MKNVTLHTRRAQSSNIAKSINQAAEKDFNLTANVTVSENAPCKRPDLALWKKVPKKSYDKVSGRLLPSEHYPGIVYYYQEMGYDEIWIKTSTLGGASQVYVK